MPWFRKMFPRNRFQLNLKFFHVVDNRKIPKRNSPQYRYTKLHFLIYKYKLSYWYTIYLEILTMTNMRCSTSLFFFYLFEDQTYANTMFTRYYQPQQDICVDETIVGTRGRTAMLQYIPLKHSKFVVKVWVLAESTTGYIVRISCYLGKKFKPVTSGVCQGTSVVLDLLRESELLGR